MKTFRKNSRTPLAWLGLLLLLFCLAVKLGVKAQDEPGGVTLPSWQDADIGTVASRGGAQADGAGGFSVSSGGVDIWDKADSFHYVWQPLNGNGQIVARVLRMDGKNLKSKAGVMLRETLATDSRNAMMRVAGNGTANFSWRPVTGNDTFKTIGTTNVLMPYWVKLVRNGDWVSGYGSEDGANWTLMKLANLPGLSPQIYFGLAVVSHSTNGAVCTGWFDQASIGGLTPELLITNSIMGSGDGLAASYYDNRHLYGRPTTNRVDATINFDFSGMAHVGATNALTLSNNSMALLGMAKDSQFSVRWTGEVQAQYNEPYTFSVESDEGVRVWLNEQLIIDRWNSLHTSLASEPVNLIAGQRYLLRVEYFDNHTFASVQLAWSSPSTPLQAIPQSQLYSQPTDTDGNGLPDLWEQHYFGHLGVDPKADPDSDGLSNLQEYRRHSDPTDPLHWGVPNEWWHGDIEHSSGSDGYATYSSNGVFTVASAGNEIWGRDDNFHYLYQSLGTNGEMVARLLNVDPGTNLFAKAGVIIRESLNSNARNAMMRIKDGQGFGFSWRLRNGVDEQVSVLGDTNTVAPCWIKIVRSGDWVGGYGSYDGVHWTLADWRTFKGLRPQVLVGLGVTSHPINTTNKLAGVSSAQFDQVSLASPAPAEDVLNVLEGDGDGLLASYRNDSLLYLPGLTNRIEPQVNLYWTHTTQILPGLNPDAYGACWSGEVQAQFTEPYTLGLKCRHEDWVRVWVNEQLVIDGWRTVHPDTNFTAAPLNLIAGQHYLIRVEMFNNRGHGVAELNWNSPSTRQQLVPQTQLYSQPTPDPDGSGLPVLWEQLYFGHTGVDPNADPDGDGLSNLQEYLHHTNPTKADTDADGLPDLWEINHGLDPQYADDAGLDSNNSGLNNLQDYQYGLDPLNPDSNGDGLPDYFEAQYLGTGAGFLCTNQITVAAVANGAQATDYLGTWQVDAKDIVALDRRGGVDFNLSVANADKYILNLIGTQNQPQSGVTTFKLLLGIDGQTLGHYTLNAGYGTNGTVELVLPYIKAGSHTVHVFWDGYASYSSLRVKQVKLLSVSGATNQGGVKNWAAKMISDQSGLDNTNAIISSYTSPITLEGRDPYPALMTMTSNQTNALSPTATSDGRWYVNAPLQAGTQTMFQVAYQNGARTQTRSLQWMPVNLLTATGSLTIRKGDSLLLTALPANGVNGNLQITISGTNTYTGKAAKGISYKFTTSGTYTVTGTYTSASGSPQNGGITVDVVPQQNLPNVEPAAWTWMPRNLNLANLAPEAVLQADSRLDCTIVGTNENGAVQLNLGAEDNEERSLLARLGTNGPVLDSTQIQGFDIWSGDQAYTKLLQVYPDGSQLVEMLVISSPVNPNVTFLIEPIVGGVMFDDGTTSRTLTATNFDALGQCPVRFIRPAATQTSVCNSIKAYQGNYQIGYRH